MADNKKKSSRVAKRQQQLAQEKRQKMLKTWLPIGIIVVAFLGLLLYRIFQPGIEGMVEEPDLVANQHDQTATYPESEETNLPPMGGVHYPTWQKCGIYASPLDPGYAVHSMEHGAIWIAYNDATISDSDLQTLEELANDDNWVLLAPYPDLASNVVVTAWGKQLQLDSASDRRLNSFVSRYRARGPEAGTNCADGNDVPM